MTRLLHTVLATVIVAAASRGAVAAEGDDTPQVFELTAASIADINAAFDAGVLTSERLVELYLARIAA
jgi:predicted outer membrane protein